MRYRANAAAPTEASFPLVRNKTDPKGVTQMSQLHPESRIKKVKPAKWNQSTSVGLSIRAVVNPSVFVG